MSSRLSTLSRIVMAGCGSMGLPMARALHTSGFATYGFDVRPIAEFPAFSDRMLPSLDDLSSDDTLWLVVRDQQQINDICFGKFAVYNKNYYPQLLVVSSTISPKFIDELAQKLPDDVTLIDAPMSGAPIAAIEKTLTFMVGGDTATIERLMPAFNAMGTNIYHLGDTGQGMLAKVLNNYVAACNVISVRKSIAHAQQLGMPADRLLEVVNRSSGNNWFANKIDAIDWSHESYEPGNTIGILEKDVTAALDVIDSLYDGGSTDSQQDDFGHAMISALRTLPAMPERD